LRLSDIISGYIEPNLEGDDEEGNKEPAPPVSANDEESEDGEGADDPFDDDAGLDPAVAKERFEGLRALYNEALTTEKKHGQKHKKCIAKREELAKYFMDIKLSPRQFNKLSRKMRNMLDEIRSQERMIMDLCVNKGKLPRKAFITSFINNETNVD